MKIISKIIILVSFIALTACSEDTDSSKTDTAPNGDPKTFQAVYDGDQRTLNLSNAYAKKAKIIAAMVSTGDISDKGDITPIYDNLGDFPSDGLRLCSTEKFLDEPVLGYCTASLIAGDVVITAGHCIPDSSTCSDVKFAFDASYSNKAKSPLKVRKADVFSCKKVLYHKNDNSADVAILRLNKPARRNFLHINLKKGQKAKADDALEMIGHSEGMPTTVSPIGKHFGFDGNYLMHDLDSFGGNSGAPVMKGYNLHGIHAKRSFDHYVDSNGCNLRQSVVSDPELYGRTPETFFSKAYDTTLLKSVFSKKLTAVKLQITSLREVNGKVEVNGWACALGRSKNVNIIAKVDGTVVKEKLTHLASTNKMKNTYCETGSQTTHGFSLRVPKGKNLLVQATLNGVKDIKTKNISGY